MRKVQSDASDGELVFILSAPSSRFHFDLPENYAGQSIEQKDCKQFETYAKRCIPRDASTSKLLMLQNSLQDKAIVAGIGVDKVQIESSTERTVRLNIEPKPRA